MTGIRRCRFLQELLDALGYDAALVRGSQPALAIPLRARVQSLGTVLMAEEVYPQRLSLRCADAAAQPTLLLLLQGRCILEPPAPKPLLWPLQAGERNAALFQGEGHDLTITQVPCRMVRFVLPPGSGFFQPDGAPLAVARALALDLALLLPMQRLLEQALHLQASERTRTELAQTLLDYVWDRLAAAGCVVRLTQPGSSGDPLQQLERWMAAHLGEALELADLAAAVNLSPRRLQELCRSRHHCTPMEWLRECRLERLAQQLRDPRQASRSLQALMAALHLPDSAATRSAFLRRFGCSPSVYRQAGHGLDSASALAGGR